MSNDKLKLMHGTTVMKRMEQSVIDEINDLMERGRYLVYLQPKVDIHTVRTEGAEALIRQLDPITAVAQKILWSRSRAELILSP